MTVQKQESRSAAISLAVIAFVILIALGLVVEILRIYAPGVWAAFSSGDGNALETCFEGADTGYSVFLLWVLSFVQILSIVLPAMPVQLVAGIVLDPWLGTAVCLTAYFAAHMAVFTAAKRAHKLLGTIAASNPKLQKLMNTLSVSHNRTYLTVVVLLAPGLPNGMIPYAAANSGMSAHLYFLALLIALPLPTLVTCIAGRGILAGSFLISVVMLTTLYVLVGILFAKRDELPGKIRALFRKKG